MQGKPEALFRELSVATNLLKYEIRFVPGLVFLIRYTAL